MNPRFKLPAIYCISDGSLTSEDFQTASKRFLSIVQAASLSEISMFQVREKALTAAQLCELAAEAVKIAESAPLKIIVNGRADIALAAGAAGVHLPADGVPASALRKWVRKDFIIGVSAHSLEEAAAAKNEGADFVTFGPVFESPGKGPAVGTDRLKAACDALSPFPVIALGGIDGDRLPEIFQCGAAGFAAIRYLNKVLRDGIPVDQNTLR